MTVCDLVAPSKTRSYNITLEVEPCCDTGRWQIQLESWWVTWLSSGGKAVPICFTLPGLWVDTNPKWYLIEACVCFIL